MSALKVAGSQKVRAEEAIGMVDCGRASQRTKGVPMFLLLELGVPPFNWLFLL